MASHNQRATNEQVIAAYRLTGSVWKAGKHLGMAGQSIHERLRALGIPLAARKWTPEETREASELATSGLPIGEIARRLGRPYGGVAHLLSNVGIRHGGVRRNKIPRGVGLDKRSVARLIREWRKSGLTVYGFSRRRGIRAQFFINAVRRHFPDEWDEYVRSIGGVERACGYCEKLFLALNNRHAYCTPKCAADARVDRRYFGGNRRATVGMAEGVCQLCGRKPEQGLSSHHVIGKENDPANDFLVALCQGCHKAVTLLATRLFVDDPVGWESLIALVWSRRHGADIASLPPGGIRTLVEIEWEADEIAEVPA